MLLNQPISFANMYSLFDTLRSDFRYGYRQPQIYVVSEESLQRLEKENTERRIQEIEVKIERLQDAKATLTESLNLLSPAKEDEQVAA